jgi:hypothetical protein
LEQAGIVILLPSHDSDVSDLSDSKDDNNRGRKRCRDDGNANSSDEDEEGNNQIAGDHWKKQDFIPTENPSENFWKHLLRCVGVESQELGCKKCLRQWPTHPSKLGDFSLQLVFLRRLLATQTNFGRMKFKVRIISKAARYGIKLYVVTDAVTPLFLASSSTQESSRIQRQEQNQLVKRQCKLSSSYVNPFAEPSAQFTLTGSIAQLIC